MTKDKTGAKWSAGQRLVDRPTDIELRFAKSRWIPVFWIAITVIVLNLLTGIVSYSFMVVRCGVYPITASRFAAAYHYYLPGTAFYGPNMFAEYYCTANEAEQAGFNPY